MDSHSLNTEGLCKLNATKVGVADVAPFGIEDARDVLMVDVHPLVELFEEPNTVCAPPQVVLEVGLEGGGKGRRRIDDTHEPLLNILHTPIAKLLYITRLRVQPDTKV